jgi:hypothetical protein
MAATPEQSSRSAQGWANYVVGILVFALGVALMLAAFYWGYTMLRGVDDTIRSVQVTQPVDNPAVPQTGKPSGKSPLVAQVPPPPKGGPTLLEVASAYVLKLVILLVLAAIGAMTASRGAQLAGMRVG